MYLLRLLPLCLLFWAAIAHAQTDVQRQNLCFFSLKNSQEFELTRSFLDRANGFGGSYTSVYEFHDPRDDANPESSFRKMIEANPNCDGLVISGHHTGSFGGKRAQGVLDIRYLEELSCDAQYKDFFQQVKSVWLQGCRTLGIGPMGLVAEVSGEFEADYHMQRVGAELVHDGLEQSFADLSFEFSATLDQDNPLASRYLRVFPAANVFGWTKSSPGEKSGSENSLLFHMAHMAHLSSGDPLFDPLRDRSSRSTANMSRSFSKVLSGNPGYSSMATDAWLSHGRVKNSRLGFDNPDLNAYSPLLSSSDDTLLAAKSLGCDLRSPTTFDELQRSLARVLSNKTYVAYNFNVIWEIFRHFDPENPREYDALRNQLVSSMPLMSLLNKKLKSPQTGLLMKIEYYAFYRELTGNQVIAAEALILEQVHYFMLATDLAGTQYDIRDFRESLLLSLARYQLADLSFYKDLIHDPATNSTTLYALTWSFLKASPAGAESLMDDIVGHPEVDSSTLRGVALWLLNNGTDQDGEILRLIIPHPEVDESTLGTVASVLRKYEVEDSNILVREIVVHPQAGSLALSQSSLAVRKYDLEVEQNLLIDILSHPAVDKYGVQNVSRIIVRNKELGSPEVLEQIVTHDQVDSNALSSVAIALGNHSFESTPQLLESIRNHPKADARTLKYVDLAVAKNQPLDKEEEFF